MKIKILTDTSCGIPQKETEELGYEVLGLPIVLDSVEYDDKTITFVDFYEKLRMSKTISTSQSSIEKVTDVFDRLLEENDYIIYLPITSGLSGSYNTGLMLANDDKYKGRVFCVNHRTISVLQREMLCDVKVLIDKGCTPQEILEKVENNNINNHIWLMVDTLDNLKKGGRLNAIEAGLGAILGIKPILYSDGGKFDILKKERSVKKALDTMKTLLEETLKDKFSKDLRNISIGFAYTENRELAEKCSDELKALYGDKVGAWAFDELPCVVGCHTGIGAVGMALYKHIV